MSNAVLRLVADHVDSVIKLELLLLLRASAGRGVTAAELAAELRADAKWVTTQLGEMSTSGVVAVRGGRYHFEPATPALNQILSDLAEAYAAKPVSVIGCIHGRAGAVPTAPIRCAPPRWQ